MESVYISTCKCDQQETQQARQTVGVMCSVCKRTFRRECDKACQKRDSYQCKSKVVLCSVSHTRDGLEAQGAGYSQV